MSADGFVSMGLSCIGWHACQKVGKITKCVVQSRTCVFKPWMGCYRPVKIALQAQMRWLILWVKLQCLLKFKSDFMSHYLSSPVVSSHVCHLGQGGEKVYVWAQGEKKAFRFQHLKSICLLFLYAHNIFSHFSLGAIVREGICGGQYNKIRIIATWQYYVRINVNNFENIPSVLWWLFFK